MKLSKREYILGGVILVLSIVVSLSFFSSFFNQNQEEIEEEWFFIEDKEDDRLSTEAVILTEIMIDIKGAVKMPGVYVMSEGHRVIDAIEKAGGILDVANTNQINFAAILSDEMVIYVPEKGEEGGGALDSVVSPLSGGTSSQGKIRINHATAAELERLNGIGPSKAASIITYREQNGPFKSEEDLLNVTGIGAKSLEKMRDQITVK